MTPCSPSLWHPVFMSNVQRNAPMVRRTFPRACPTYGTCPSKRYDGSEEGSRRYASVYVHRSPRLSSEVKISTDEGNSGSNKIPSLAGDSIRALLQMWRLNVSLDGRHAPGITTILRNMHAHVYSRPYRIKCPVKHLELRTSGKHVYSQGEKRNDETLLRNAIDI